MHRWESTANASHNAVEGAEIFNITDWYEQKISNYHNDWYSYEHQDGNFVDYQMSTSQQHQDCHDWNIWSFNNGKDDVYPTHEREVEWSEDYSLDIHQEREGRHYPNQDEADPYEDYHEYSQSQWNQNYGKIREDSEEWLSKSV